MGLIHKKLPLDFYQSQEVVHLAKQLLGKQLVTDVDGIITSGIIVETEAYGGVTDKASHAYGGRFTNRTQVMYGAGGISYVYLCYGIHSLLNVVTGPEHVPHAVLIRALEPTAGIETMLKRRSMEVLKNKITQGPGALSKAMGVNALLNSKDLTGDEIWIEDVGIRYTEEQIIACPRIGVDYAAEDALLPWRFYVKDNKYVSRPLKLPKNKEKPAL